MQHSIKINASKEKVWDVLWEDQSFRDWASIIDKGTYMMGELEEGNEIHFISSDSGYGVTSKVEKLVPYTQATFKQIADIKLGNNGSIEKRKKQWAGSVESYELNETNGTVTLSVSQDVPDELVEIFNKRVPQALERIKVLAET